MISLLVLVSASLAAALPTANITAAPNNLYCTACTEIANEVVSEGCSLACDALPPPANTICDWILSMTGLCAELEKILSGGETPEQACTDLGFCGSACECGVCTQAAAGPSGRCLGFPNDCGHSTPKVPAWLKPPPKDPTPSNFCVDGQCDGSGSSYGCCLTCF